MRPLPHARPAVLLALALSLCFAATAVAKQVTVTMTDGRRLTGELVSDTADTLTIKIANIDTPLPRDRIAKVEAVKSVRDEYAERRKQVKDNDIAGRIKLARWLYDHKEYQLVRSELAGVFKLAPDNADAQRLDRAAQAWIKHLQATQSDPDQTPNNNTGDDGDGADEPIDKDLPTEKLNEEQINWIRILEYYFKDPRKPRVVVPNEVIDQVFVKHADSSLVPKGNAARNELRRKEGWEKLELLFQLRDRELYGQVEVRGDPKPMTTFRNRIHRNYVLNYCGTAGCHGGPKAGEMFLFRDLPNSDETVYTNFYILHRTENKQGNVIDRDFPDKSLLVQYGMPRDRASTPHPEVAGWQPNPAMIRAESPMAQSVIGWVRDELYRNPDYQIDYKLPKLKSQSKPETPATDTAEPATEPQPKADDEAPAKSGS